jgi:Septum formation
MAEAIFEHEAQVRAALHAIVADPAHGVEALSSPQVMANLLKDFLPDAPRESGLLIAAAQARIADALRENVSNGLDATTAMALASTSLAETTAFTPDACSWATRELAIAMGLADARHAPDPPGSPQPPPFGQETVQAGAVPTLTPEAAVVTAAPPSGAATAAPPSGAATAAPPSGAATAAPPAAAAPPATELAQPLPPDPPAQPEQARKRGAGRAILIIVGCLVVVVGIAVGVAEATSGPSGPTLTFSQLRTGDCLADVNFAGPLPGSYVKVPCSDQHEGQVFFWSADFWPRSEGWPGNSAVSRQANAGCSNGFAAYDGLSDNKTIYDSLWTTPAESNWRSGQRSLTCIAYLATSADPGGAPIRGSIQNSDK